MTDIAFPLVENEAIKKRGCMGAQSLIVLPDALCIYSYLIIRRFADPASLRRLQQQPISFLGGVRWRLELLEKRDGLCAGIEERAGASNGAAFITIIRINFTKATKTVDCLFQHKIIYYTIIITITGRRQWRRFLMKSSPVHPCPVSNGRDT